MVEGDAGPLTKKFSLGRTQYEGGTGHMVGKVGALQKLTDLCKEICGIVI